MRHLFLTEHYPEEQAIFSDLASRAMYCPLKSREAVQMAIALAKLRGDRVSDALLYPGPRNGAIMGYGPDSYKIQPYAESLVMTGLQP